LLGSFAAAVPVHFFEQRLHGFDSFGQGFEFGELFLRQPLPAGGGTGGAAKAEEQLTDFVERETDLAGALDVGIAVQGLKPVRVLRGLRHG
jgi:hypothetical protein